MSKKDLMLSVLNQFLNCLSLLGEFYCAPVKIIYPMYHKLPLISHTHL